MNNTQTPAKTVQDIQLDLLETVSYNECDGARIKQDLLDNRNLWEGAIMGSFEAFRYVALWDIANNVWNADTLMILPQPGKEGQLVALASKWGADEVDLLEGFMYGGGDKKILRLWWD
jgi:hypothetical protein